MKKMWYIEIVCNNESKLIRGTKYLRCCIKAENKDEAKNKALTHYVKYYTGGDRGQYYVQCCWDVKIPTREIIMKHWRKAGKSIIKLFDRTADGTVYGAREYIRNETKKAVMDDWDSVNIHWCDPAIHYDINRGGYVVSVHFHMSPPNELKFFKGATKENYKKAKQFVKDNTLKEDYFMEL